MKTKTQRFEYRRDRVRGKLRVVAIGRPRLSVHRSLKYLYAQIVDDNEGMFDTLQQHQEVDVSTREIKPFYKVRVLQGVDMDIASPGRGWPGIASD